MIDKKAKAGSNPFPEKTKGVNPLPKRGQHKPPPPPPYEKPKKSGK